MARPSSVNASAGLRAEAREIAARLDLDELRSGLRGRVIEPSDDEYDRHREIWNAMIDRYPAVIAGCESTEDVVSALDFGRSRGLPIAVRAGGHSVAGNSICDRGIVIDLRGMRAVQVDPAGRVVTAGGGALLRELDAAAQVHGLAVPAGVVSHTGVAGLALGGGMGWLTRKCGLTCDNLLAADMVTPASGPLSVDDDSHPELMWGLRGGGGNFGIVTRFCFQAHPIGPTVPVGFGVWKLNAALPVLRRYREVMPQASADLRALIDIRLGASRPELGPEFARTPILGVMAIWTGSPDGAHQAFRSLLSLKGTLAEDTLQIPFVDLQRIDDDSQGHGANNYTRGGYLDGIADEAIQALQAAGNAMTSPESMIELGYQHGAQDRLGEHDTAFANRASNYYFNVYGRWPIGSDHEPHRQWARESFDRLSPWRTAGVYTNFLNADDQEQRIDEAYGKTTLRRLVALKDQYDPHNALRLNQNVSPTR